LLDSLGPGKTCTTNKQNGYPRLNRGASTSALFLLVLIEFSRFKEYKNKLGKRLLSICMSSQNSKRDKESRYKIKNNSEKTKIFGGFFPKIQQKEFGALSKFLLGM